MENSGGRPASRVSTLLASSRFFSEPFLSFLCQSMEINQEEDCDKASELVGFPMIVKPQMGAGSAGMHLDHTQCRSEAVPQRGRY